MPTPPVRYKLEGVSSDAELFTAAIANLKTNERQKSNQPSWGRHHTPAVLPSSPFLSSSASMMHSDRSKFGALGNMSLGSSTPSMGGPGLVSAVSSGIASLDRPPIPPQSLFGQLGTAKTNTPWTDPSQSLKRPVPDASMPQPKRPRTLFGPSSTLVDDSVGGSSPVPPEVISRLPFDIGIELLSQQPRVKLPKPDPPKSLPLVEDHDMNPMFGFNFSEARKRSLSNPHLPPSKRLHGIVAGFNRPHTTAEQSNAYTT